jgi:TolB protein
MRTPLSTGLILLASLHYMAAAIGAPRHGSFPWASPDGKQVVFASSRSAPAGSAQPDYFSMRIYRMDADGANVHQLTDSTTADFSPVWSPDGLWIVFTASDPKTEQGTLTAMHPDGSARHAVMSGSFLPWVRLSPDGQRVIFTRTDAKENKAVHVINMDGSGELAVATGLAQSWDGLWSPDGKQLVFSDPPPSADPTVQNSKVYIADADGQHRRLLATYPGFLQLPAWSPDGRSIAYQTYTGKKGEADVVVLDVATGKFRTVSRRAGVYLDETPAWMPDGRLLFQSTRGGRYDVYIMDADGSHVELLTR